MRFANYNTVLFSPQMRVHSNEYRAMLIPFSRLMHLLPVSFDLELVVRLLAGSLLTYALSNGLMASDGVAHAPPPERIAALVWLLLQASARPNQQAGVKSIASSSTSTDETSPAHYETRGDSP